jgi:hypothetical protein
MKALIITLALWLLSHFIFSQACSQSIDYELFYLTKEDSIEIGEFLTTAYYNKQLLHVKGVLKDCRGKCEFIIYDPLSNNVSLKGKFANSLDIMKGYSYSYNEFGDTVEINVIEYYMPLRDSTWVFYHADDSTYKKYVEGIPVE